MKVADAQWQTSEKKLKHDRRNRRITLFDATLKAIEESTSGRSQRGEELTILTAITYADWLFDGAFAAHVNRIWSDVADLHVAREELRDFKPANEQDRELRSTIIATEVRLKKQLRAANFTVTL